MQDKFDTMVSSLKDVRRLGPPFKHSLKLTDQCLILHHPSKRAPKKTSIVQKEIQKMLHDVIIRLLSSAWSFAILKATKTDVHPHFFTNY